MLQPRCQGEPASAPIVDACVKTKCPAPAGAQQAHRIHSEHTVRAATVGDDVLVARQLRQTPPQVFHGNPKCSGNVPGLVFLRRTHVNHDYFARLDSLKERFPIHGIQFPLSRQKPALNLLDLGQPVFAERSLRAE